MTRTDQPTQLHLPFNEPGSGIVVYRASRLEALLQPLEDILAQYPPKHLLGVQTVLAAHPGIQRWLGLALARRRGVTGIVANLDIRLPSAWIEGRVREELGVPAIALEPYRREALRWRIHELLPTSADPGVRRYLASGDARRRVQMADRVAAIFSRYLVYRPDWLAAWERGKFDLPEPNFLAPLWQQLRSDIGVPHRGDLLARVVERRRRVASRGRESPVHVFGLSHLPPSELALLRAEARHRLVVMYVPDPCVHYWAGLGDARTELARLLTLGVSDSSERELLSLAHPLLAAWGRMGQHFGIRLHEGSEEVHLETRHGQDHDQSPESASLLHRLQQSIRLMSDEPLPRAPLLADKAHSDASLLVHGCHTRVRELEVLHDAIRAALVSDQTLHPSQILVMSPDTAAYAALVPSVFGATFKDAGVLPFHFADVAMRRSHPLFDAFAALLQSPVSRVTAPQVLDLLQVPAIARALGITSDALTSLRAWLTEARVAWGLDGGARSRLGLPAFDEHSLAWGMDRLVAGYVYGAAAAPEAAIQAQVWPVAGVHGVQVDALGALDRLLCVIDQLSALAQVAMPLSRWCAELHAVLRALFRVNPNDQAEREALATIESLIEGLKLGTNATLDPPLEFAVVRDLVGERLDAVPAYQAYLLGGITFSGMVPQRSLPFRMIAILGLNDGEFPRSPGDGGIDLMSRYRELGDRDVRNDDRYLFLETVMACRSRLHLSFLSEGMRDGKMRNPAPPLAELLAYLDARAGLGGDLRTTARAWFVQHPLQPFDERYFDHSDPRLYSFEPGFAQMVAAPGAPAERFLAQPGITTPIDPIADEVLLSLHAVTSYFRRPAEQLLKRDLNVRLDALEADALRDREPLQARFESLERIPRRLVFDALAGGRFSVPSTPDASLQLTGLLPPGELGTQAYASAATAANAVLAIAASDALLAGGLPAQRSVDLDQRVGRYRVQGTSTAVFDFGATWVLLDAIPGRSESALNFKQRIPLFIEWALLRLKFPEQRIRVLLLTAPAGTSTPESRWDDALTRDGNRMSATEIARRLGQLLDFWRRAQAQTAWYFPATSWTIAQAKEDDRITLGRKAWGERDGFAHGEIDNTPGYERVLARATDLFAGADWIDLRDNAIALHDTIRLDAGIAGAADRRPEREGADDA